MHTLTSDPLKLLLGERAMAPQPPLEVVAVPVQPVVDHLFLSPREPHPT